MAAQDYSASTRWTFQALLTFLFNCFCFLDFKRFYDSTFGRKKESKSREGETSNSALKNETSLGTAANGTAHGPELAIYEQFRLQSNSSSAPGAVANRNTVTIQKPLLPPLESAEMRNIADC
ncbi:uncharacterized protein LOC116404731 isoform X2 [Cucumis sativus]|uniref:uncharacterized protein LOC116404731 isoform X2 n=1 Tax=Cucumis sativus TaxID=3659 RepID=UPI0012F4932F|nr:uncharacterized protein LOC116404731 isoform X2 [Cucumis sativus]XP_031743937.1 uncharacterized protein LOC116404731 isoform X2 [Cucumis sativus]